MKRSFENFMGARPPRAQPTTPSSLARALDMLTNFSNQRRAQSSARGRAEPQPGRLRSPFIFIAIVMFFAGKLFAADVAGDFSAANKLYAEGKFADAANTYKKILASGEASPNLLFNYGNVEFKSGNLGKAIAAFRRAELLAPRDSEIRANLAFVRNQVQGATVRENVWQNWLGNLSLNEWTVFATIAFWLTFLLLAAKQLRPALAAKLKSATSIFAALTIFSGTILGVQAANHFLKQTAVVISTQATARSGPFDDAQNAFAIHDGAELSVLDQRDDWVQVADGAVKTGWLPANQIEILPGA
jgi:tetratricopeptide (TPR) repeat protein